MEKTKLQTFLRGVLLPAIIWFISAAVFANNGDEIILPIEFSSQGFPITSVQIQNHNIPLIFDIGAAKSSIVLSRDITKKLNLQLIPTDRKVCSYDDTGKKTCRKVYTIPELKIGNMIMHNISCELVDKLWGGHYDEGFIWFEAAKNGVMGLNLLRQFNVLADYKTSKVILSKLGEYPHQYNMKNWIQVPFSYRYGITTVTKINGVDAVLVWDTGANSSIMKSTANIPVPTAEKKSCASINNKSCTYYFETITFQVNDKQLPKTRFVSQKDELPFDGLIGSDFFKKHIIFFDFKNNILFIQP